MENKFDIYSFINSPDVAKHCQKINHRFTTTEKARLIFMSYRSDEEKLQGYKWLIENAEDDKIPNKSLSIPGFARAFALTIKDEPWRKRDGGSMLYFGRESVLSYLKDCTASGKFVLPDDKFIGISNLDITIPHPFKKGDLLEHIKTGEIYVVERAEKESKFEKRSQYMLWLLCITDKNLEHKHDIELSDLRFWYTVNRRPLPEEKSFLFYLGKFFKDKKGLTELLNAYGKSVQDGHILVEEPLKR